MEYETIKQNFYDLYEKYNEFINLLESEQSDGLAILCFSHRILDEYFNYGEDENFSPAVYEFLIDTSNLDLVFTFFKDRIEYLFDLYTYTCEKDLDCFNALMPNVYYFFSLDDILHYYRDSNIDDPDMIHEILMETINVSQTIDEKIPYDENEVDELDIKLNRYLPSSDTTILTNIIFSIYEELVKSYNEEAYEDNSNLLVTLNDLLVDVSNKYGDLLLKLNKDNKLYKNIMLYKSLIEKTIEIFKYTNDDVETLENYFGIDLDFITSFYPTLYLKSVTILSILEKKYEQLEIVESRYEDIIKFTEVDSISSWIKFACEDYENFDEYVDKLIVSYLTNLDKNLPIPENTNNLRLQLTSIFFEMIDLEFESVEELTLDLYRKISNKYNESLK